MERITRFRAWLLVGIVAAILCIYSIKLYSMQVADADVNGNNVTTYMIRTRVRAARGDILDINGNKLVTNRASYDLHLNHYVILNATATNARLLELVELGRDMGLSYTDHFPVTAEKPFVYTLDQQSNAWKGYYQKFLVNRGNVDSDITAPLLIKQLRESYRIPAEWSDEDARAVIGLRYELTLRNITNLPTYVLLEDASEEVLTAVLALDVPGMTVEASAVREYSTTYAAHILGYIGAMNAEQWEHYKEIDGYEMDALVGQSGLEKAFESYLHGIDGVRIDRVTKDGVVVESYYEKMPQAGNNVELSIDLLLQMAAEDALAQVMENGRELGRSAEGGAVVAIDVKTGQVLVCGSYPTYDLSTYFEDYEQLVETDYNPLLNRALTSSYAPGSTYKVSMLVAAGNAGVVDRYDTINDTRSYKIPGYSKGVACPNHKGFGTVGLDAMEALMGSCNYFFCEMATRLTISQIDETAKSLGLGELAGVELKESPGYRSNAATLLALQNRNWSMFEQLQVSIGQSVNAFTPIQLASYASTLANAGTRYKATFLSRVVSSDYRNLVYEYTAQVLSTMTISQEARYMYLEGMKRVANSPYGTAYSTFKNYPIAVAAKTGSAQHGGQGPLNGAFICFAPAENPQIAIAVFGEKIGGGSYLAPVAKAILDTYFGLNSGDVDNFENGLN
jgi:penicillin-binding protein 2